MFGADIDLESSYSKGEIIVILNFTLKVFVFSPHSAETKYKPSSVNSKSHMGVSL